MVGLAGLTVCFDGLTVYVSTHTVCPSAEAQVVGQPSVGRFHLEVLARE
jgi:hypothetical protein